MSRIRLLVFIFAAFIAAEPVVHTHPLVPSAHDGGASTTLCAACAGGTSLAASIAPAIVAPATVIVSLTIVSIDVVSRGVALTLPSRAPPSA